MHGAWVICLIIKLVLWKGLQIAKNNQVQKMIILGDSMIIICCVDLNMFHLEGPLSRTMGRINQIIAEFDELKFFHVIRNFNIVVDTQANIVVFILQGTIKINVRGSNDHTP